MLKIITVVGARPQIIKAAALSRTIRKSFAHKIEEIIIHTGQHYDENMSEVFFKELEIPKANYNLNVGSGAHGAQTATMIKGIEDILIEEKPNYLVLYGDTNSTLAGAIAASKIHIPIVHIEAGLRSFNKSMPEEINRIMCDHASTFLFSPTSTGFQNLKKEGFSVNKGKYTMDNPGIFHCGDVMYDNSLYFSAISEVKSTISKDLELYEKNFNLVTIHRNNNTDDVERLSNIFEGLLEIAENSKKMMVLPLHPRTKNRLDSLYTDLVLRIHQSPFLEIVDPVSFLDMIQLEKNADLIITDSGGVQKEAYFFSKPCIVLRKETEWVEIVEAGTAVLVDADPEGMKKAYDVLSTAKHKFPPIFGNGNAAKFICDTLIKNSSISS
ncbi:non-hydrolyzing UDP-N-acetylglucosamine 2-epimerase [Salinimicrobium xinjiangense]|uniref:non-hydrolyzing UDP-N-acetylglucosamine 2-epimerase n=1 Tax=Salinimicrobium xinjiangense TaxID=438596 RepID=UPI00041B530F|nr:UDP-N-acetylglucosamine 2-epimerase (non-hydrolyzing) [Salinimicrobium xinjiangense]